MRRFWIGWVAAAALVAAPRQDAYTGDNSLPPALQEVGIDQKLDAQLPLDLVFTSDRGERRRLGEFLRPGKPAVLALVYYRCPMLCTLELNALLKTLRTLEMTAGKEFDVLTVSFDPDETADIAASKKKEYVERYRRPEAESGWHFLTGEAEPIRRLTEAVGFRYTRDEATGQWAHASGVMVVTPDGRLARYFYGIDYSPRDLKLGLVEAAEGKIGTFADQVLLFCYHWDPLTGKYGLAVMTAVRAGGLLTIGGVLAFWGVMFLRGRKRRCENVDRVPAVS